MKRIGKHRSEPMNFTAECTATLDLADGATWKTWVKAIQEAHQAAADEDGGMHNAGVEILLAYENGATVDDCMMRMFV